ncbi:MAG: metal ABC transporter permease [Planctomycetota bacterium]|jgi:zinc/manganese transport system permease protein
MFEILAPAIVTCLILTGILCYLGIHVIMREVIFVDLALAQIAATGAAIGIWMGFEPHSVQAYLCGLGFTLIGAAIFTVGRFRDARVPQEAIIGIVYAVSTAIVMLILSKVAIERDEIEHMLVGRLLFVAWPEVVIAATVCAGAGIIHLLIGNRVFAISTDTRRARAEGVNVYLWDFGFYATLGLVVTVSVQLAGVLLVFSFLVVPASCAMIFFAGVWPRLLTGWLLGAAGSAAGLAASAFWDLPTGASVVAAFGAVFVACTLVYGGHLLCRAGAV